MKMIYEKTKPNDTGGVLQQGREGKVSRENEGIGTLADEGQGGAETQEGRYEGSGVYCFTHRPSGKKYVGSSSMCARRRMSHENAIRKGDGQKFHQESGRLGLDSFTFEIIEKCSDDIRSMRERFWIEELQSTEPNGFNMNKPRLINDDDPQIVINLDRNLHRLLKKAAAVEGRTIRLQATHILRSNLAPLLSSAAADLPPQRPRK